VFKSCDGERGLLGRPAQSSLGIYNVAENYMFRQSNASIQLHPTMPKRAFTNMGKNNEQSVGVAIRDAFKAR